MYLDIILLLIVSAFMLIGFGKRVLADYGMGRIAFMTLVLITVALSVFPEYHAASWTFNISGMFIALIGIYLFIFRSSGKEKLFMLMGTAVITGVSLLYAYFVGDSAIGRYDILYYVVITLAALIVSTSLRATFYNISMGVLLANIIAGNFAVFNKDVILVGGSTAMIIGILAATLVAVAIDMIISRRRENRKRISDFEAAEEEDEEK